MATYAKSNKRLDPVELFLDESYHSPTNRRFYANIEDIKITLNPNFVPGDESDGVKTPFKICFEKDGVNGRPVFVFGDRKQGRVRVPLPIKKFSKKDEGYVSLEFDSEVERDQSILRILYLLKQSIHDALKKNPQIVEKESLTDEEIDQIVKFPIYSLEDGKDRLRVKVRTKVSGGDYKPKVFHRSNKKQMYKDINKISKTFDPEPADPSKRFTCNMTLWCELENCYFNYKRNMETKEFYKDDNDNLIPMIYPVFSLYQAIVSNHEEIESVGIQTKIFELEDFPAEKMQYEAPFEDVNGIMRAYNNIQVDGVKYNWRVWARGIRNPYGVSISQKTGEPTHLSAPLEGETGDLLKNLMDIQRDKALEAGLTYSKEFFKRKLKEDKIINKMEDDRGQFNIYFSRKRDENNELTDEIDDTRPPTIRLKTATNPDTGEYRFPVCFPSEEEDSKPGSPLPHSEADNFLKTRGTTYDVLIGPKTLSSTSVRFTQPFSVYQVVAHTSTEKACGIFEDDSDSD